MGNAWHIGTFFGIPVKIHWSFGLLLLFITYTVLSTEMKSWQAFAYGGLVLTIFFCVILHEYGHALTGKKFGVITQDIIVSPIGGLARMQSMPEKPMHEFYITIAGPLVNLVIGIVIGLIFYLSTGRFSMDLNTYDLENPIEYIRLLAPINFTLFLFNLIPAFPMDGGRILRSLLATKIGKVKATKFASFIGKVLAVCFVIYGVFDQQLILALIGLFIFMMAGQEYDQTKVLALINNTTVGDIMRTSFTKLHLSDTYATVIEKYYREGEQNFLVFDSMGNISGTIPELFIKDTIKDNAQEKSVNQMMSNKLASLAPDTTLKVAIETMRNEGVAIVSVEENGALVGVLDRNGIENFLRMKSE
jgi:Zn-dependent protease/predicted transcriptional regulator